MATNDIKQEFKGIGIAELYYKEDGNIYLHFYVSGNSLTGAGSILINIELNNNTYKTYWFAANSPSYSHDFIAINCDDTTGGKVNTIRVTGTKDGVSKFASSSITYPTQEDMDKIKIKFIHKETNPPSITNDEYTFYGYSNKYGKVRYSVDSEVTDESDLYYDNLILKIANDDSAKHTIYYRYKCGLLVANKSFVVDHSGSGSGTVDPDNPDYRVPYILPDAEISQIDRKTFKIDISKIDFTKYGVTGYSVSDNPIKVKCVCNNTVLVYSYAEFYNNGKDGTINIEFNYSTRITVIIYNSEHPEDTSKGTYIDFVYTTPRVKLIPPTITWITSRTPDNKVIKQGVAVCINYSDNRDLNEEDNPGLFNEGNLYCIYTTDGSIPTIDNTIEKLDIDTDIRNISKDCIINFKNVFIYNDETIEPTYSDNVRFVYAKDNTNPFYFDYVKPPIISNNNICSYLDVICNENYETTKTLDSISYILNYFEDRYKASVQGLINVAEDGLRKRYAGYYLDVYSDETQAINLRLSNENTNATDENNRNKFNHYNEYKYAIFDKGKWNFNYFRNNFDGDNKELSEAELNRACNYIYYNNETKENEVKTITEDTVKSLPVYKSDNRSLIYGKYIVSRFIFPNDDAAHRFKLENVTFNISDY